MNCRLDDASKCVFELPCATRTDSARLLSRHTASGSVFYAFDNVGNTAQRVTPAGSVIDAFAFDAFGNRSSTDVTNDPFTGFGSKYGYYRDASTGLELLGHRYYDTYTGMFLTRDKS